MVEISHAQKQLQSYNDIDKIPSWGNYRFQVWVLNLARRLRMNGLHEKRVSEGSLKMSAVYLK